MKNQLKTISIKRRWLAVCLVALLGLSGATRAAADSDNSSSCTKLPSHAQLKSALQTVVTLGSNGGLGNDMWGTAVNRDRVVCAVVFTGTDLGSQWLGSRGVSPQKATTPNAFRPPTAASA